MTASLRHAALAAATALLYCATAGAADVNRKVPGGTLTYRIVLDGEGGEPPKFPMLHDAATLHRSVEATAYLDGMVTSADPGPAKAGSTMDQLQKQLEACNGDQACGMAVAMKLMKTPGGKEAFLAEGDRLLDAVGRNTLWAQRGGPCHIKGEVHSTEQMSGMDIGEGYSERVDSHATRSGKLDADCSLPSDGASITLDGASNRYTLVLPAFKVKTELDDKSRGVTRADVGGPEITIKDLSYVAGKPLRGKKVYDALFYVDDTPAFGRTVHIPMHAVVTWEFIPD